MALDSLLIYFSKQVVSMLFSGAVVSSKGKPKHADNWCVLSAKKSMLRSSCSHDSPYSNFGCPAFEPYPM